MPLTPPKLEFVEATEVRERDLTRTRFVCIEGAMSNIGFRHQWQLADRTPLTALYLPPLLSDDVFYMRLQNP
jgi:hypothetical protein